MRIPEETRKEHLAICENCIHKRLLRNMADVYVDWLDCPWGCENDYEHWNAKNLQHGGE